ncbi:hypothetical protein ACLMJK_009454 [Lecanora helva]
MAESIEAPPWEQPSHPSIIQVHHRPGSYSSYATSLISLPAGALFTPIKNHFYITKRTWPSVESPCGRHIDLNSDLFYVNHSCAPTLEYDVSKMEVRVSRYRDLCVGDNLSFFYPSTEWAMVQPFVCFCNESECLGQVSGAGQMPKAKLKGYWLNRHIEEKLKMANAEEQIS